MVRNTKKYKAWVASAFFSPMIKVHFYFPSGMSCSRNEFSCAGSGCVSWTMTCNEEKNCEDGTDEPSICKNFPGTKLGELSL